ncbi:MAG: rod shape-determining protein MreC [Ignavibacteriales bacterium]|nr:rod shape-determining protein MreC [Ignavibacteriales bacterium]MCB9218710.1 rod shape-determining protein MreC [Ignavibacteriales bacterium]MCB9259284.1 rod shape-determining protein MreC [Ignavibacteriales bacterium]
MPQFIRVFLSKFKEYIVLVLLLILSLVLITLNNNDKVRNVRLYTLGFFASLNSSLLQLTSVFENTEYIESLEKHNAELMLENNRLRIYGLENQKLNDILNFQSTTNYKIETAKIISRLVSKINGYFIINKGIENEISEGMPVITDEGFVGIIIESSENYSVVRTFENSLFKVAVKIQRSNVNGILNWDGKNLLINNVPTTDDVEVGDRVVISELSSILPPTIPVGIVSEKESTVSGVLSNLKIKPFVELNSTRNVMVIKVHKSNELDSLLYKIVGGEK